MKKLLLMHVAESVPLTGLGVLLLPSIPLPALADHALHTGLALTLRFPNGQEEPAIASVEEVSRPEALDTRALLLTQDGAGPVPPGTEVWWTGEELGWE